MKTEKVLLGVLAAAAIGAIAGVLFAPDKGSKTRRKIIDKSEDYSDDLKKKFDELKVSLLNKYSDAMQEVDILVAEGKNKYNQAMDEVDEIMATGKTKILHQKNENV